MIRKSKTMMPRRSSTPLALGLVLTAGWFGPAAAQNPFEFLFGNSSEPAKTPQASPTAAPPSGMPATAILPPKRPAAMRDDPASTQALGRTATAAAEARPVVTAAAPAATPAAAPGTAPLGEKQIVERANAYFNAITSLVGDFVQVGGDGRKLSGKLYLQRPGKIRFEYDAPATLEVIADGSSVAVRDLKVTEVAPENDAVRVSLEDKSTLGGTSKITLYFDKDVNDLTRCRILDPQGFQTTVSLANIERNKRVDQSLFTIDYQRIITDSNR